MELKPTLPLCWAFFPLRFEPSCRKYAPVKILLLQFDKDIYKPSIRATRLSWSLNQRKTFDTLTVGILKEVYGQVLDQPKRCQHDYVGIA